MDITVLSKKNLALISEKMEVPAYPAEEGTYRILHLGVGNFHRSHQAYYLHKLLMKQPVPWRICGAGLMPQDLSMKEALRAQDYYYTQVAQEQDSEEAVVIGSISDFIHVPTEFDRFVQVFTDQNTKILSLTVTEKGYCYDSNRELDTAHSGIIKDLENREGTPETVPGLLVYCLNRRLESGAAPLTIMSCDNIPKNGDILRQVLMKYIGLVNNDALKSYVEECVTFPCTMVDRITPVTTDSQKEYLQTHYGISDRVPVFSEAYIQWVIEDHFVTDRPAWETVGAQLVDDVKHFEYMKIRLLNGSHSALSYLSLLKGYEFVDDAMGDELIHSFLYSYMNEIKESLEPMEGQDYDAYIQSLLKRFGNSAVRDRLLRLAEDGSIKIPNAIIEPLMMLLKEGRDVPCVVTALAAWIVYLAESNRDSRFPVKDPNGELLRKKALTSMADVRAFLSVRQIFPAEILEETKFIEELSLAVKVISGKGISEALKACL